LGGTGAIPLPLNLEPRALRIAFMPHFWAQVESSRYD